MCIKVSCFCLRFPGHLHHDNSLKVRLFTFVKQSTALGLGARESDGKAGVGKQPWLWLVQEGSSSATSLPARSSCGSWCYVLLITECLMGSRAAPGSRAELLGSRAALLGSRMGEGVGTCLKILSQSNAECPCHAEV